MLYTQITTDLADEGPDTNDQSPTWNTPDHVHIAQIIQVSIRIQQITSN